MTTQPNDGGPAFPQISEIGDICTTSNGMTLRDWFAGQSLAGLMPVCLHDTIEPGGWPRHIAHHAYEIADAMIAARGAA
jgi:hypothetical protein